MITWTEEELNAIYKSEEFIQNYQQYADKTDELNRFLNSIQLNRKYFRLTTNGKIGKNIRFKNKNISQDTISMKEINSYLNKLTDRNIKQITKEIKDRLTNKEYLKAMIIENIIHKCIVHPLYNTIYIDILLDIYKDCNQLNQMIETNSDTIYQKIINKNIDTTQSEYLQFCDKNRHLDLLIGYSLLITELEKKKIIENKIGPSLNELLNVMEANTDIEEKYKCCQCLYNIFKSYYESSLLPQGYIDRINTIQSSETSMKIKFKLMDILERK
jgi:hypothetical protein